MAISLFGLRRTLTWSDFRRVQADPPGDNDPPADAANTSVHPTLSVVITWSGDPPTYVIGDGVVVRVSFDAAGSYQYSWVAAKSADDRASLLAHEQGHYDIAALLARDCFFQLVALRANSYSSESAVNADKDAVRLATIGRQQEIFDLYDAGTSNGTNAAGQATWSGYVRTAFTLPASPPSPPVSGVQAMKSILDVLSDAGEI